jgi:2'-5' RNA ligase
MRLFLAIDLPKNVKRQLEEQLKEIKKEYPFFNWVSAENFHVTVHFFGEVRDIRAVREKIKDLLWDQKGFSLYSFNLGVFVNDKLVVYLNFRREKKLRN